MRRTIFAAIVAALAVGVQARADSITLTFPGLKDGQSVYNYLGDSGGISWIVQSSPPATAIGPGNPEYAGTPGLAFSGDWSVFLFTQGYVPADYLLESIAITVSSDSQTPAPIELTGRAYHSGPVVSGPSWSWSVTGPGSYQESLAGFLGDTIDFSDTGFFEVTQIILDFQTPPPTPPPTGPNGAVPEPAGLILASIAAGTVTLRAKKARPRERVRAGEGGTGEQPRLS